jgi:hypothetical protein
MLPGARADRGKYVVPVGKTRFENRREIEGTFTELSEIYGAAGRVRPRNSGELYMATMSICDRRLFPADAAAGSSAPGVSDNNFYVDATWKIADAFLWVKNFANGQPGQRIPVLSIFCHGFYQWNESEALQQSALVGGFGLQLCQEGLLQSNLNVVAPLVRGKITDIVIYACGTASDQASGPQNGTNFCRSLAGAFNAVVYAADRSQVFNYNRGVAAPLNFGEWEGTVYRYTPDGIGTPVGTFPSPNRS